MARAHFMLDNQGYRYTHNMQYFLLLFQGNVGYANARECYVYAYIAWLLYCEVWRCL